MTKNYGDGKELDVKDFAVSGWEENRLAQLFDFARSSPEEKLRWLEDVRELLQNQLPNRLLTEQDDTF